MIDAGLTCEDRTVSFTLADRCIVQMNEERGSGLQMKMGLRAIRKVTRGSGREIF